MLTYSRSKDLVRYDVRVLHLSGHVYLPETDARAVASDNCELALALPGRTDFFLTRCRTRLRTSPSRFRVISSVTLVFVPYLEDSLCLLSLYPQFNVFIIFVTF